MQWTKIFNPDKFLERMIQIGELSKEEFNSLPYHAMVSMLCHNACAWMSAQNLDESLREKLHLVTGSYKHPLFSHLRVNHSWVEFREEGKSPIILDLTLAQFKQDVEKLYVGEKTDSFNEWASASFASPNLIDLIESI